MIDACNYDFIFFTCNGFMLHHKFQMKFLIENNAKYVESQQLFVEMIHVSINHLNSTAKFHFAPNSMNSIHTQFTFPWNKIEISHFYLFTWTGGDFSKEFFFSYFSKLYFSPIECVIHLTQIKRRFLWLDALSELTRIHANRLHVRYQHLTLRLMTFNSPSLDIWLV